MALEHDQYEQLVCYIDDELDETASARLEDELRCDDEMRSVFSMLLRQRTMLALMHHQRVQAAAPPDAEADTAHATGSRERAARQRRPTTSRRGRKTSIPFLVPGSLIAAGLMLIIWYIINNQAATVTDAPAPVIAQDLPILMRQTGDILWQEVYTVDEQIAVGETIVLAANADLRLRYPDGTLLSFDGGSKLTVRHHKRIALNAGTVHANVRKQKNDHTLEINCPNGDVTVHGTTFDVEVNTEETVVSVSEGIVRFQDTINKVTYTMYQHQACLVPAGGQGEVKQIVQGVIEEIPEKRQSVHLATAQGRRTFVVPWRDGGHDEKLLRQLRNFKAGQHVRITWYDDGEHPRILEIERMQ